MMDVRSHRLRISRPGTNATMLRLTKVAVIKAMALMPDEREEHRSDRLSGPVAVPPTAPVIVREDSGHLLLRLTAG
jgi:hypothetical protein